MVNPMRSWVVMAALVAVTASAGSVGCRGREVRNPPASVRASQSALDTNPDHDPPARSGAAPADPAISEDLARGQAVYLEKCARCHGADGRSQTPDGKLIQAPNIADPAVQARLTDNAMAQLIQQGKGRMIAVPLEMPSLRAVIAYVRRLGR